MHRQGRVAPKLGRPLLSVPCGRAVVSKELLALKFAKTKHKNTENLRVCLCLQKTRTRTNTTPYGTEAKFGVKSKEYLIWRESSYKCIVKGK